MEQCNLNPPGTLEENLNPDSDSLQEVINTLLPRISGSASAESNGREPMVADNLPSHYQDIGMDSETRIRAAELAAIANSIEERLLPPREFKPEKSYKIDYADELNLNQLSAVLETSSPLLVIAGAGSGKTRVITFKVSWLIEPHFILLTTSLFPDLTVPSDIRSKCSA